MSTAAADFHDQNAELFAGNYTARREFQERRRVWNGLLAPHIRPGGMALDVGCGSGAFSLHLARAGMNVLGIDPAPKMLDLCREAARKAGLEGLRFEQGQLPLADDIGVYDLIICCSVLEYMDDLDASLASLAGKLTPTGVLVFSLPNRSSIDRKLERVRFKLTGRPTYFGLVQHSLRESEARARVASIGLHIDEVSFYGREGPVTRLLGPALTPQRACTLFAVVSSKRSA